MHVTTPTTATTSVLAATLAAIGGAIAIPIPLAQLDFAGLVDVFHIDAGDTPSGLRVLAAIGGVWTVAVIAVTFAGAVLAFAQAPAARVVLGAAATAGFVTALPLWLPSGILLAAAAVLAGGDERGTARVAAA